MRGDQVDADVVRVLELLERRGRRVIRDLSSGNVLLRLQLVPGAVAVQQLERLLSLEDARLLRVARCASRSALARAVAELAARLVRGLDRGCQCGLLAGQVGIRLLELSGELVEVLMRRVELRLGGCQRRLGLNDVRL